MHEIFKTEHIVSAEDFMIMNKYAEIIYGEYAI